MHRFLLFLCFLVSWCRLGAQDSPLDQSITIVIKETNLENALLQLVEETAAPIVFRNDLIPDRRINVSFSDHRLEDVLQFLLLDTDLRYRVIGALVVLELTPAPPAEYTMSGFISDATTGERLIGATVVELNSQTGAYSDEYGFYSIRLPAGLQDVRISYTGYQAMGERFTLANAKNQDFRLQPSLTLREVVVIGRDSVFSIADQARGSGILLDAKQAQALPTLGGEADILRLAHFLPGVHTGTDGVDGLHIRGGDAGQNLVLIDGVPIYDVNHALGLFSIFDAGAVRQASLYKGGFPARYGGRLSGVLDVRTKEGNLKKHSGRLTLGLLTAKMQLEGPIATDRTSFFISGRKSFVNTYLGPVTRQLKADRGENGETDYSFYDLNFKLQHILGKSDRLHFSYYQGMDAYADQTASRLNIDIEDNGVISSYRIDQFFREQIRWGNKAGSFRWNHAFGEKLVSNLSLTYSQLEVLATSLQNDSITLLSTGQTLKIPRYSRFDSGIKDAGAKLDFHFIASPHSDWRFGIQSAKRDFSPGVLQVEEGDDIPGEDDILQNDPISGREVSLYVEQSWQISKKWNAHWGARYEHWRTGSKNYGLPQLRLQLNHQISPKLSWHGSAGKMVQFLHLLSNSTIGLPTDLWVPATESIHPATALQYSTGLSWQPHPNLEIELDVYYKDMSNLVEFSEGANFLNDWQNNVTSGKGIAKGIELLWRYQNKRLQTQFAYTLAESRRQFEKVNLGSSYPFKYDRRHDFKAIFLYRLRPWLLFSTNWVFNTGFAFSLPLEKYRLPPIDNVPAGGVIVEIIDYGEKNSFRMPDYHRLDVNFQLNFGKKNIKHQINLGVYNIYNRQNPLYIDLRTRYVVRNDKLDVLRQFVQVWLAPFLPSVSYAVSF